MKKYIAPIAALALSATGLQAQFFGLSTNLFQTNTVAASITLTSTVTNSLDVRRYSTVGIVAVWSGSNTNTNSVSWSFQSSPDGTNWETATRYTLAGTSYGTNRVTIATNVDVRDVGWLRPWQVINSCTNSLTNVVVYGLTKEFPRN